MIETGYQFVTIASDARLMAAKAREVVERNARGTETESERPGSRESTDMPRVVVVGKLHENGIKLLEGRVGLEVEQHWSRASSSCARRRPAPTPS